MSTLTEVDSVEVRVVVDNEVDPLSEYRNEGFTQVTGRFLDIGLSEPPTVSGRGAAKKELKMESLCCGAHGLSLVITAVKDGQRKSLLFDTGPEERVWELNAKRIRPLDLAEIEAIHLSHWHRDHSGGMLSAVKLIKEAKAALPSSPQALSVDLHPNRPDYRGFMTPMGPASLQADPSFDEIRNAGGMVTTSPDAHTVLDGMFLISGEIPRVTPYEKGVKYGARFTQATGTWEPDELILDERLVMCKVKGKGLVVFSGCSHAGVVNATRHAVELGGGAPVFAVMGGYHLVGVEDSVITETVKDLKALDPKILLPGHCSGWRAKFEIEKEMPGRLAPSTVGTRALWIAHRFIETPVDY